MRSLIEDLVTEIQQLYPRIYIACHVDHEKARSSAVKLSARDSSILAHLSVKNFERPSALARHLNVSASTMSEALHNLVSLGYVRFQSDPEDERRTEFKLTDKGVAAMKASSVLDTSKVALLMERLSADERARVIDGLKLLADAAVVEAERLDL